MHSVFFLKKKKNIFERLCEIASLKSDSDLTEQTINGHVLARETELKPFFRAFLDLSEETRIKKTSLPHSNSWIGGPWDGKTALAKSVCDDDETVKTHFQLYMRVCVSDGFNLKQAVAKMTKSPIGDKCIDSDTKKLQEN
jgi:hypothetical protein